MLIGGADVSGSAADGQHNHVALVVGKEDAINRIYNNIGVKRIHMSRMSESQRAKVRANLDLSSAEISVWCFHVGRQRIENAIQERMKLGNKRKSRANIRKSFASYWFLLFEKDLANFAARFRAEISDISIEVDSDMRPTVRAWNINGKPKGRAHELSDAVAWFNQKGIKIQDCKVMDLRRDIQKSMERYLLK